MLAEVVAFEPDSIKTPLITFGIGAVVILILLGIKIWIELRNFRI